MPLSLRFWMDGRVEPLSSSRLSRHVERACIAEVSIRGSGDTAQSGRPSDGDDCRGWRHPLDVGERGRGQAARLVAAGRRESCSNAATPRAVDRVLGEIRLNTSRRYASGSRPQSFCRAGSGCRMWQTRSPPHRSLTKKIIFAA